MKVVDCTRHRLYDVVSAAFQSLSISPVMIELGVHRGENAEALIQSLKPHHSILVDAWSAETLKTYSHFDTLPPWILPLTAFERYFGGSLSDQATFDRAYATTLNRFDGASNLDIIRADTIPAFEIICEKFGKKSVDFIYVDANHQYDYVLRDLLYYKDILKNDGIIMLNDCCHSQKGMNQNLGVLEAAGNFIKRTEFVPLALSSTDMSDLILARSESRIARAVCDALDQSDLFFVEVLPQLLPLARIRVSAEGRARVSFS